MRFITSKREYQEVYSHHKKKIGNLFIFLIREIPEDTFAVGIIVSKRVGNAVRRNKVKRRVRAYLRELDAHNPKGKKIIIIAKPEAGLAAGQAIFEDLRFSFKTLICNENF